MHNLSPSGAPLLIRYDLDRISRTVDRDEILVRIPDMWIWRELLPIPPDFCETTLGECMTPLLSCPFMPGVYIKDEGRLPTGSFKARGMAMAVTMARHFGLNTLTVPTAGNAGAAAAAYGAAANLAVHVFTPIDTPEFIVREIGFYGASIYKIDGLIDRCGKIAREASARFGWHDLSTLAEPYRLEGKKTIGFELALQFGWKLPDAIYYPTGGGTGFIGMWKAFNELQILGWLSGNLPKMISVQTNGCNPIQRAIDAGDEDILESFHPVTTKIPGVRVPKPLGGRLILDIIRKSGGHACAVSDEETFRERETAASDHGIYLCPEGAACRAAYLADINERRIGREETVVIFNTASGYKWPFPRAPISDVNSIL